MNSAPDTILRATGLLIIEVLNSNPNGDPDNESDPRMRQHDSRGEISPVSFKRKLRDLVEDKEGVVWQTISRQFDPPLNAEEFKILESRDRKWQDVVEEVKNKTFQAKYWDGRVFGNTFLQESLGSDHIRTGVVQFGVGLSLAPIEIERLTTSKKAGAQEGKDRGMAPLGFRVVQHGVYAMPFFVNATAARKSGCTARDIQLLLNLIPYAYQHTASYVRNAVEVRHAWCVEHRSPLGSASDFEILGALTPRKTDDPETASTTWNDYQVPTELPEHLRARVSAVRDLVAEAYAAACA
jgi:CRISPR-associated protein Csd2